MKIFIETYIKLFLGITKVVDPWCNYKVIFFQCSNLFFLLIIVVFSSQPLILLLEFFKLTPQSCRTFLLIHWSQSLLCLEYIFLFHNMLKFNVFLLFHERLLKFFFPKNHRFGMRVIESVGTKASERVYQ